MAIERRTLKKAPQRDVVDALTSEQQATPPSEPDRTQPAAQTQSPTPEPATVSPQSVTLAPDTSEQRPEPAAIGSAERRGPGRPRSKRRMEALATKIDIELRDQVDAHLAQHGGTLVDLIDEALRDRLRRQ